MEREGEGEGEGEREREGGHGEVKAAHYLAGSVPQGAERRGSLNTGPLADR